MHTQPKKRSKEGRKKQKEVRKERNTKERRKEGRKKERKWANFLFSIQNSFYVYSEAIH
jgi:hypothetical protein